MNGKIRKSVPNIWKQLQPGYIIAFAFCFMLFVYEPILMYSTNKNDFWFDFGIMIFPTLLIFLIFLGGGVIAVTVCYLFLRLCFVKERAEMIYQCVLAALFVVFLATYIQGNFLAASLPGLTGDEIVWDQYLKEDLLTIVIWIILEIAAIGAVVRFRAERVARWGSRISVAVMLMLLVGLTVQVISNDALKSKDAVIATNSHSNDISTNKNFLIFVVDAVNAEDFQQLLLQNEAYREVFRDFTFYTDTVSVYPFTRDSMPLILTGQVNQNEEAFETYSSEAYNNSELFARLTEENYDIGLYMDSLTWYGEKPYTVINDIKNRTASPYESIDLYIYFRQELKYVLFKYLPYAYKQYSQIEGLDFKRALEQYDYDDVTVYDNILSHPELTQTDRNLFQFIHIEGAHLPFEIDENLNPIEKGTYRQKIEASIEIMDAYLTRLKNNGAYDNSIIMILADHGYYDVDHSSHGDEVFARYHPILLIKGFGEEHELIESDLPVSHLDLMDAYMDLLDGKKGSEVFAHIGRDENRKRKVIWYEYLKEDHMIEYELEGSPDDWSNFKPTGNVFDR